MKIAYKPYSSFPQSFEMKHGINPAWPAEMKHVDDDFSDNGWTVVGEGEYKSLVDSLSAEKETYNAQFESDE